MNKRLTYILKGGLLFGLLAGSGCTEQGLDYRKQEGTVHIALSWEQGSSPAGSRFFFYPADGGEALVRDCPPEGFSGLLPTGSYKVVVLNNDALNIGFRNTERYHTAEIYVLPDQTRAADYICQPDNLLLASGLDEGETLEVPYLDTVTASASPCSCVKRISFLFHTDDNLSVASCSGTLSGVCPSMFFATGVCSQTSASVDFTAVPAEGPAADYRSDVLVLGLVLPGTGAQTHLLNLNLEQTDASTHSVTIDLTEEIGRIIEESGGAIPVEIPLDITLTLIDNILHASIRPWDEGGEGSGDL